MVALQNDAIQWFNAIHPFRCHSGGLRTSFVLPSFLHRPSQHSLAFHRGSLSFRWWPSDFFRNSSRTISNFRHFSTKFINQFETFFHKNFYPKVMKNYRNFDKLFPIIITVFHLFCVFFLINIDYFRKKNNTNILLKLIIGNLQEIFRTKLIRELKNWEKIRRILFFW